MLLRFGALAVLLLAAMFAAKSSGFLARAGLTGACWVVNTSSQTQLEACRAGWLEGQPSLSEHGCAATVVVGKWQYWSCPAPLVASPADR